MRPHLTSDLSFSVTNPQSRHLKGTATDHWFSAVLFGAATLSLGYSLQINNGNQHPKALWWLTITLALSLAGIAASSFGFWDKFQDRPLVFLLSAGFAFQISQLLKAYSHLSIAAVCLLGVLAALVLLAAAMQTKSSIRHLAIALVLAVHFGFGVWTIRTTPNPPIDVYLFHRDALVSLTKGINPYTNTIPNIYPDNFSIIYGPDSVSNGRVKVGFPYPPLTLVLTLPGHLLGDYRYSLLAAITLSGVLMAYGWFHRLGLLATGVFLSTPRMFYLIEFGWNEPLVVLLLTLTLFCAWRAPKYLPLALGLFFAIKQYTPLAAPLAFFLLPGTFSWKRFASLLLQAVAVALLITLPAFLFNAHAFIDNVILFQIRQPFRMDSLSYLSRWAQSTGRQPTMWIGLAMFIPATALAWWRASRTPSGFALAVAFVYLVFFALSKQAFVNYYFFVLGAMCAGVAILPPPKLRVQALTENE